MTLTPQTKAPPTLQRLRRRRHLLFWLSLPIALFAIFWGIKFLSLAPTAQQAIDAYDDGYYVDSQVHSTSLLSNNVVETYLPYFNRGDAYAGEGNYTPAIEDFEIALELAPMDRKCDVRLNLALSWERFGDAYFEAGFYQGAVRLYEASEAVLADAGEECEPPQNQEELQESEERVQEKREQAEALRDAQPPPEQPEDGQSEQEQQLEQLQEQQEQAAQEKADDESESRGEQNGGYYTEKPW